MLQYKGTVSLAQEISGKEAVNHREPSNELTVQSEANASVLARGLFDEVRMKVKKTSE